MSIFERQLRIWGDSGQTRIEDSICCISQLGSKNEVKLLSEMITSLKLAGLRNFVYTDNMDQALISDLRTNKTRVVHIIYTDVDDIPITSSTLKPLPDHLKDMQVFEITILESSNSPVVVTITKTRRRSLFLSHHQQSIPPFALSSLPLSELCRKYMDSHALPNPADNQTTKLPWLLILFHCHQQLQSQGLEVNTITLKAEIGKISCDEECLKEARLHMYWILNEPKFNDLIEQLNGDYLNAEELQLKEKLEKLGRYPICSNLWVDEKCDPEVWSELNSLLLRLADEDQELLQLDPFVRNKGLGCLTVMESTCTGPSEVSQSLRGAIASLVNADEKVASLAIDTAHLLRPVLSSEAYHNVNNTILHGLNILYRYESPTRSVDDADESVRREYPALAKELFERTFNLPEAFRVVYSTIVGASISTEVLKALTQQFSVQTGIVMFDVRNMNSLHITRQ